MPLESADFHVFSLRSVSNWCSIPLIFAWPFPPQFDVSCSLKCLASILSLMEAMEQNNLQNDITTIKNGLLLYVRQPWWQWGSSSWGVNNTQTLLFCTRTPHSYLLSCLLCVTHTKSQWKQVACSAAISTFTGVLARLPLPPVMSLMTTTPYCQTGTISLL